MNKPPEQGAVSFGSPSQASAEGALAQWRDLNFLQLDEDGSHSDHSPHSAQSPATTNKKDQTISDALHIVGCLIFTGIQKITSWMKLTFIFMFNSQTSDFSTQRMCPGVWCIDVDVGKRLRFVVCCGEDCRSIDQDGECVFLSVEDLTHFYLGPLTSRRGVADISRKTFFLKRGFSKSLKWSIWFKAFGSFSKKSSSVIFIFSSLKIFDKWNNSLLYSLIQCGVLEGIKIKDSH